MTKKNKKKKSKARKKIKKLKLKKRKAKSKIRKKITSKSEKELLIKTSKVWSKRAYVNKKAYEKKYNLSINDNENLYETIEVVFKVPCCEIFINVVVKYNITKMLFFNTRFCSSIYF
mgnify:CR=1 FL=1